MVLGHTQFTVRPSRRASRPRKLGVVSSQMGSRRLGNRPKILGSGACEDLASSSFRFYPGDSVQKVLEEATEFVKRARINQSGRILSWDEVQQFAAGQPDKWGRKYLALRFVTLMQTADGFSWELLEPVGHK